MNEDRVPRNLTREDISALRTCDNVSLHSSPKYGCYIRAYIAHYTQIYTAVEQRLFPDTSFADRRIREIPVTASIQAHGDSWDGGSIENWQWNSVSPDESSARPECFYSTYRQEITHTVWRALSVGDELHLKWTADNNSATIRLADLHADEVSLRVRKAGGKTFTYLLGYTITLDNSARMIRKWA